MTTLKKDLSSPSESGNLSESEKNAIAVLKNFCEQPSISESAPLCSRLGKVLEVLGISMLSKLSDENQRGRSRVDILGPEYKDVLALIDTERVIRLFNIEERDEAKKYGLRELMGVLSFHEAYKNALKASGDVSKEDLDGEADKMAQSYYTGLIKEVLGRKSFGVLTPEERKNLAENIADPSVGTCTDETAEGIHKVLT